MSIKPALTAEEWEYANGFSPSAARYIEDVVAISWVENKAHAIAALCLHDQPFGFRREEIPFLERANGLLESHLGESIAPTIEKILALLPPESSK